MHFILEATHKSSGTEVIFRCDGKHFYMHYEGRSTSKIETTGHTMASAFQNLMAMYNKAFLLLDETSPLYPMLEDDWDLKISGAYWEDEWKCEGCDASSESFSQCCDCGGNGCGCSGCGTCQSCDNCNLDAVYGFSTLPPSKLTQQGWKLFDLEGNEV